MAMLVRGRCVITGVDAQGRPALVEDGAVVVAGGRIAEIGPHAELARRHPEATTLGSPGRVIAPGFVNAHHHVGMTPLQLGSPDLPLELWIVRRIAGRTVDPYLDTLYSAFEMIQSGITTVQHLHGRAPRPPSRVLDAAGQIIAAYRDIGMRVSYSFWIRDQNRILYEDDAALLRRLPADLAAEAGPYLAEQSFALDESLAIFASLHATYQGEERVKIQLAPLNLHCCSDQAILRTVETARKFGVPMHMHLVETALQKEYARRRTGTTALRHIHGLGALGPDMTLGHGVWLTEADIALIAETGTAICHNCSSNLRLRSGVAALNAFRKAGVPVALGIDEAGLNDDRDMLQEMRLVLRLHREPGLEESEVPSAAEVFRMATEGGARTTPFGDRIGTLAPGKAADLVLFRWDQVAFPYLSDDVPVIDALVQRARTSGVDSVMVAGEMILDGGRFTRIDKDRVLGELAAALARPPSEADRRNRTLGLRLLEEARRFYKGYASDAGREPFYKPSSRV
jgi:cytosine/adenosine deaminase-related metal-dependent hydrolase